MENEADVPPVLDPVIGFVVVWLFTGSGIAWLFNLIGLKSLRAVGVAYAFALVPAAIVAAMLTSN